MANIGSVSVGEIQKEGSYFLPIDERISGLVFDIGGSLQADSVFSDDISVSTYFGNEKIQKIFSVADAMDMGITEDFLEGLPLYHISKFYEVVGVSDAPLYVAFSDFDNAENDIIERLMTESSNTIFQIGIWSTQSIFTATTRGYTFSKFITNIHSQASSINVIDTENAHYTPGVNIIIDGVKNASGMNVLSKLPDCTQMEYSDMSILLGENKEDGGIITLPSAHTGMIGTAMGCLCAAYAEESVAFVDKFNLNRNDTFATPAIKMDDVYYDIASIDIATLIELCSKGYIFPTLYDAKEGGVYLCSESTMSHNDYSTISNCRVANKVKRVAYRALTSYINAPVLFDGDTESISSTQAEQIMGALRDAINASMVNQMKQSQLSDVGVYVDTYQPDMADKDMLAVEYRIVTHLNQDNLNFVQLYKQN